MSGRGWPGAYLLNRIPDEHEVECFDMRPEEKVVYYQLIGGARAGVVRSICLAVAWQRAKWISLQGVAGAYPLSRIPAQRRVECVEMRVPFRVHELCRIFNEFCRDQLLIKRIPWADWFNCPETCGTAGKRFSMEPTL